VAFEKLVVAIKGPVWRPIETAPKDGTEIDLWVVAYGPQGQIEGARRTDCRWQEAWTNGVVTTPAGWFRSIADGEYSELITGRHENHAIWQYEATHWRPRPPPP
jgi:hypothetical protein